MKVIAKINKIPKIYLFFNDFKGEIFQKNNKTYIKSFITNNTLEIEELENNAFNKIKFILGKSLIALMLIFLAIYDFINLGFGINTLLILSLWIFIVAIACYQKNMNEDLILFIGYLFALGLIFIIKKTIFSSIYYYAVNTIFYIGNIFLAKSIKEYLYESKNLFKTKNNEFIIKAKEIK